MRPSTAFGQARGRLLELRTDATVACEECEWPVFERFDWVQSKQGSIRWPWAESAVVPSPNPIRSSIPKAYVAPSDEQSSDAGTAHNILMHVRSRVSPYKRVRYIEFSEGDLLLGGASGKIQWA